MDTDVEIKLRAGFAETLREYQGGGRGWLGCAVACAAAEVATVERE